MEEYKNNEELIDYLISKNVIINDKEKVTNINYFTICTLRALYTIIKLDSI